jgi:hypothetical protein
VKIVDDTTWEPDEEFFLKMSLINNNEEGVSSFLDENLVKLGRNSVMEIIIINDDGTLTFCRGNTLHRPFQSPEPSSLSDAVTWSRRAVARQSLKSAGDRDHCLAL